MTKQSFMETNGPRESTLHISTTRATTAIFGSKIPSTVAFLGAILLFLLPFAEVRCNGKALANNTGLGIAMGSDWKELLTKNIFDDSVDIKTKEKRDYTQNHDPNVFAIAALALGVIGVVVSMLALGRRSNINFYVGLLAAASLVAMLIDLRSKAKTDTSVKSSDLDVDVAMKITVDGTAWYYVTVILFIAAAILALRPNKSNPT